MSTVLREITRAKQLIRRETDIEDKMKSIPLFNFSIGQINELKRISREKNKFDRNLEEAKLFISALREFVFFKDYESLLSTEEWIAIGISARLCEFKEFQPICQIWDLALKVFFNLSGDIGVALDRKGRYNQEFMDKQQVAVLKPGMSFGEIGVLYDEKRTASCIALGPTICISLNHDIFKQILGNHVRKLNNMRLYYLSNLKLFSGWDRASLAGLLNYIYLRTPKHGSYVYETGEKNNNIYIVVSGELEIMTNYRLKEVIEEEKEVEFKNNDQKFEQNYMKKREKKKEIALFKLSEGNYFGDEEGFREKVKQFSVKVTSNNTKIFLIPKEKIVKNANKSKEKLTSLLVASERRAVMISDRKDFMKKFKAKRIKHDENVQKKAENNQKKEFNQTMQMLRTFTHSDLTKNSVTKNLKKMKNHPSYPCLRTTNFKSTKDKLKKIDSDFEHCISNLILSEDNLQRNLKKRKIEYVDKKNMPKKSIVDSIKYSIRKLRNLSNRNLLSSVYNEAPLNSREMSKIEIGATFPNIQFPLTERKMGGKTSRKKRKVYLTSTNRVMMTKNSHPRFPDGNISDELTDLRKMPLFRVTRSKSKNPLRGKQRLRKGSVGGLISPIKSRNKSKSRRTVTTRFI